MSYHNTTLHVMLFTKITLQVATLRSLRWNTTPAVTISNTLTETYQISISQCYTRHTSRNLCYTMTPAVIISNTRAETYQISISQRLTRYVYNVIYITARHVQRLSQILAQKHIKYRHHTSCITLFMLRHDKCYDYFKYSRWNISNIDIAMLRGPITIM